MNIFANPIIIIEDTVQWETYNSRWGNDWTKNGGKPLRFPCIATTFTYVDEGKAYLRHIFAYEEVAIAYRKALRKAK